MKQREAFRLPCFCAQKWNPALQIRTLLLLRVVCAGKVSARVVSELHVPELRVEWSGVQSKQVEATTSTFLQPNVICQRILVGSAAGAASPPRTDRQRRVDD